MCYQKPRPRRRFLAIHKALWSLVDDAVAAAREAMYSQDDMDDALLSFIKAENFLRDALEAATGSRLAPYEACLSIDQEEMEVLYDPDHLDDDQGRGHEQEQVRAQARQQEQGEGAEQEPLRTVQEDRSGQGASAGNAAINLQEGTCLVTGNSPPPTGGDIMTTERIQTLEEAIKAEQEALHTTRALWEKARFEAEVRAIKADIESSITAARAEMAVLYTTPMVGGQGCQGRRAEAGNPLGLHRLMEHPGGLHRHLPVAGGIMTAESERIEALEEALKARHDADRVTKRETPLGCAGSGKTLPMEDIPLVQPHHHGHRGGLHHLPDTGPGAVMNRTATRQWRRLRQVVLQRDGGRCQIGDPGCLIAGSEIDHIVPVREGGSDDPLNLRVVCRPCHRHRRRKASRAW